ncbi:MAG: hypothetical protein COT74_03660 [Bdellovibrionales bacterium CG10_big_fil_rev_8_21_14_0_10_45_34]|nr:MAG: hypothetical protein COT74_03660 [Bdellovibrionales bacterium CG10_big_fil_rev_8_21_14_0_10_45_34]
MKKLRSKIFSALYWLSLVLGLVGAVAMSDAPDKTSAPKGTQLAAMIRAIHQMQSAEGINKAQPFTFSTSWVRGANDSVEHEFSKGSK